MERRLAAEGKASVLKVEDAGEGKMREGEAAGDRSVEGEKAVGEGKGAPAGMGQRLCEGKWSRCEGDG